MVRENLLRQMPHMQDDIYYTTTLSKSLSWATNFFYTSEDLLPGPLKYTRSFKQNQSTPSSRVHQFLEKNFTFSVASLFLTRT